jgi:signal peptidase I
MARHAAPAHRVPWLRPVGAVAGVVLLTAAVVLGCTALLGWRLMSVQSASMSPAYEVGGLAVVAPASAGSLQAGDPVVFEAQDRSGRLVVHRVVKRVERSDGLSLRTRGDANPADDLSLVPARDVRGSVQIYVPRLGHLVDAVFTPVGQALLLGLPLLALAMDLVLSRRRLAGVRAADEVVG